MNASEIIKSIEAEQLKAEVPEFRVGDTVKVYGKIKEGNRERIQVFEGVVIKRQGGSNRETFTVRKISNGCGVEKTWPLHSPNVETQCLDETSSDNGHWFARPATMTERRFAFFIFQFQLGVIRQPR